MVPDNKIALLCEKEGKRTFHWAKSPPDIQRPKFYDVQHLIANATGIDSPEYARRGQLLKSTEQWSKYKFKWLVFKMGGCGLTMLIIGAVWFYLRKIKNNTKSLRLQFEKTEATANALDAANKEYVRLMKLVAHDLRNPIGAVSAIASIIIGKEQPEDLHELVLLIETASKSSLGLINELLKTDFGQQEVVKEEIFLEEILRPCVELLKFKADDKGQRLIYHNEQQLKVEVDKEKMWRVINNIIGNAMKFSPEGSDIFIDTFRAEKGIVIKVKDKGIGIPLALQNKIFDAFSPAKRNGTEGEQPFGLGLYICKQVMEAHDGKIWFKSEPESGTEFFIEIPLYQ
ncbi:sensor histidine kinase [Mucilaginibacter sp. FT3.2]|uniref:sensor histidine kinase n=1 Tax=Mucilaginibacter sp. FT3.2 TaxID=2723090 RepID=UPI0016186CCF|nr:HAMP domain-containing sensor histidine kinase [Mucilaginibacter sp. FT3.2]MBB6234958.1 signal transduction histidine kinase [Mucilaginibacter sp. FT3.2]